MRESTVYRSILAEGQIEGEQRKQKEIALNLLRAGVAIEVIAQGTELTVAEIEQLQQQV